MTKEATMKALTARLRATARKSSVRPIFGRVVRFGGCAVAAGLFLFAAPLRAQDKPAKGVITLAEVTIVGRIQKPIASVDVNRIQPKLTLQELRQPFLDKIEQVLYQDPF
jgi:hypothetical protein